MSMSSNPETLKLVEAVRTKVKAGATISQAIKDVGIPRGTFYNYQYRSKKATKTTTPTKRKYIRKVKQLSISQGQNLLQEMQSGQKSRFVVLVGQDVSILRELFQNLIN